MKKKISPLEIFDIKNKNIILTGSAGQLGKQYANFLSSLGANLILVDKNIDDNKKLERSLKEKNKTKVYAFTTDISSKADVIKLKDSILSNFKRIDVLINNAAFTTKGAKIEKSQNYSSTFEKFPFELWQKSLETNLTGYFLCSQEFGSIMTKQKKGVIVNVSSIYGLVGADQRIYGKTGLNVPVSYAATKGAIINLTRFLASHWQGKNIRVNTLTLGGVKDKSYQDNRFIKNYSQKTILGRMANKDEYNGTLLFLISDASSYMTGSNVVVDGGWTAW